VKCLASFFFAIIAISMGSSVSAFDISLAWSPGDETALGYKLYYGSSSQNYAQSVDVGNNSSHTVENLKQGQTYYFAVTAYDAEGNESTYSNEINYQVPVFLVTCFSSFLLTDSSAADQLKDYYPSPEKKVESHR
jgi:hypothetical protein